jgi:predicted ribosomally synthesized peptide with SipW-like signal peptide
MPTFNAISLAVIGLLPLIIVPTLAWWSSVRDVEGRPNHSTSSRFVLPHLN